MCKHMKTNLYSALKVQFMKTLFADIVNRKTIEWKSLAGVSSFLLYLRIFPFMIAKEDQSTVGPSGGSLS